MISRGLRDGNRLSDYLRRKSGCQFPISGLYPALARTPQIALPRQPV